ncbi:unnamed protein product [Spirodela intermedia]|uniref:Uncharacterized protein n=1 Tax=Spirodela intermedia TaxID=51605 RepID=A0A7I8JE26_SPIIN|nr:unnamed protein product [Spirodela intermedia]CAA6668261.1 unnamed protein product [Spirodela intermedia]
MTLLVEVVSHEAIRPSAATPAHLRRIQLSVPLLLPPGRDGVSLGLFLSSWAAAARGEEPSWFPRIHTAAVLPPLDLPIGYLQLKAAGRFPWRLFIRAPEMAALRGETCGGAARPPTGTRPPSRSCGAPSPAAAGILQPLLREPSLRRCGLRRTGDGWRQTGGAGGEREGGRAESGRQVPQGPNRGSTVGGLAWEDDGVDTMEFSEWSRLGMHKTDFGWGLPVWHCTPMKDLENFVVFGEADGGAGMEAWLWLPGEVMERLREDPEVLRFVDPDSFSH